MLIRLLSLNICNDDDLIYGTDSLNINNINNFINEYNITDKLLIDDLLKLINNLDTIISFLHKNIISYYVFDNKLRSIKIKLDDKILFINNLNTKIVESFILNKREILYNEILQSNADFVLLQEVEEHYYPNDNILKYYDIINLSNVNNNNNILYYGMSSNIILYKKEKKFNLINKYIKEYGIVGEFKINNIIYKIASGRWIPFIDKKLIRLNQLNKLDKETGQIIFMGDTNLRYNEEIFLTNVYDGIFKNKNKIKLLYTIDKTKNQYFINENAKYISRIDRIYKNVGIITNYNLYFENKYEKLKNIYRPSGNISDHFGNMIDLFL